MASAYDFRPSARLLKALAHPARLRLLNALREDEQCVCHLTALLHRRQAYVSQQLMFLRRAGLIEDRKDGLRIYYRVKDPRVLEVLDAVNAVVGIKEIGAEPKTIAACPCPNCETSALRREHRRSARACDQRATHLVRRERVADKGTGCRVVPRSSTHGRVTRSP